MNIPVSIVNMLKNKISPEIIVKQMAGNNPILANVIKMAESGDDAGVEQFAKNICKERGLNLEKEMEEFKKIFK